MVLTGEYKTYGDSVRSLLETAVVSDDALPPNPNALAQLQTVITAQQTPAPTAVAPMAEICASISGKMYDLPDNSERWTALGLRCDSYQAVLLLQTESRLLEILVGLDGVYRISEQGLPELAGWMRPVANAPVAARGQWGRNNTFSITLRDLLGMQELELTIRFKEGIQMRLFERYANAAGVPFYLDLSGTEIVPL